MWWVILVIAVIFIGLRIVFGPEVTIGLMLIFALITCVIGFYSFTLDNSKTLKELENISLYNEKKESELLEKELGIPSKYILIEKDKEDYFKVTSEKGIYKVQFDYDKDKKIKSLKKVIQIESRVQ
ncbi:hypothetical protein P9027_30350 [Bacillus thuringiensis]|uniref:hypothetical protein n=1 Tax=Bacillus thuringiensis TaxID=1428 RepID=UPI002DB8CA3D|nr:hypothetical protein [Bacillus thuringiensis]MEC3226220.1 hypothetical protein [Bacillus thuringiensis]MEC3463570.1 hypothetical protein [Bacillus thuringiensis]MEC3556637.1 hypothetical protein [Bacillus thuringiensis]MED2055671.1 hypothetical protein [Bacillus thuringiensis]